MGPKDADPGNVLICSFMHVPKDSTNVMVRV